MDVLGFISIYSILIPVVIGICFYKKHSFDSKLIWGIAAIGAIPQLLNPVFKGTRFLTVSYNLYIPCEFILFFFFFRSKFSRTGSKKLFYIITFSYIIITIIFLFINGILSRFLNEWICLNSLVYTAWILLLILEQYDDDTKLSIMPGTPFFWFMLGIFLYSLCTMLIFSFWNFIETTSAETSGILKAIHQVFNINLYIMFAIGLIMDYKLAVLKFSPDKLK